MRSLMIRRRLTSLLDLGAAPVCATVDRQRLAGDSGISWPISQGYQIRPLLLGFYPVMEPK